jgi:hypothetical protein
MDEQKLMVTPTKLRGQGIGMATVADQLKTIKDAIDREAGSGLPGVGLPFLAFSALGELARHHYRNNCETTSERLEKLRAEAKDLADGLAKNAVAYAGSESDISARIEELSHRIDAVDDPAVKSSRADIVVKDVDWGLGLLGAGGLYAHAAREKVAVDAAMSHFEKVDWGIFENMPGSGSRLVGTAEGAAHEELARQALLVKSASQELSERTAATLKVAGGYSIAAFATGIAWVAGAIVRSDDLLNTAAATWKKVGAVTHRIFNEEVADLRKVLFAEWTSPETSFVAEQRFAEFENNGREFADWVNSTMVTTIDKVITDLNHIHTWAFGFACTQLMALMASFVFPAYAQVIGVYLNATFTVVMNLIGMALGTFWLASDAIV